MNDTFFNQNIAQASNLLEKGNIDRAINIFDVLSTKFPKNSQVFHLKAYAYLQSSNIKLAIENFELAIKLAPHSCDIVLDYSEKLDRDLSFLQLGCNDGFMADPLCELIISNKWIFSDVDGSWFLYARIWTSYI